MTRRTDWFYMVYSKPLDLYAISYQAGWGSHSADRLVVFKNDGTIVKGGWQWACMNGHTAGMALGVNPNLGKDSLGTLCISDTGNLASDGKPLNGVTFVNVMTEALS